MILVMVGRFHVAITATWGLAFGRGHYFTYLHLGALLFGWVNRLPPRAEWDAARRPK